MGAGERDEQDPGCELGHSKSMGGWLGFFRNYVDRGSVGASLMVSDLHKEFT